jgi:GH15 family glucan-1,4-alpha-glucosidase
MAKSQILGNGKLLIGLDEHGQVYDFYFPYVGLENHTGGKFLHKIGVWVDNQFSWIDESAWHKEICPEEDQKTTCRFSLENKELGVRLMFDDVVYNEKNIFIRNITVSNQRDEEREIRIFFNQQFEIYESYRGDTVFFHPGKHALIHYKGRRIFFVKARNRTTGDFFDEYSVGLFGIEGKEGTFKDAEDGKLEMNPIEHGLTDSVMRIKCNIGPRSEAQIDYWITVAKLMDEVYDLNDYVETKTPAYLTNTTKSYWEAWTSKIEYDFKDLPDRVSWLFYNSLKTMRYQTDNDGAVIASADSDLLKYGRDTYSYVWPRDAAFTSIAYSKAGFEDVNEAIFDFFQNTITREGFFMHKYRSDASMGSSWHPWVYKGKDELPIQLDETALVIVALWEYFATFRNVEYIERVYNSLMRKALEFLMTKVDMQTGVVAPSYDLWEERFGSATFTSATMYGAFNAGAHFAEVFGKDDQKEKYLNHANKIKDGILNNMYDDEHHYFYKTLLMHGDSTDGDKKVHPAVDSSSLYGLFKFGVVDISDYRLQGMKKAVQEKLECTGNIGGIARYEGDQYFKVRDTEQGNPWIITTLWMAQLEIAEAESRADLEKPKERLLWAVECANDMGMLPEQINPDDRSAISATPLTWSHSEFVITVLEYIEKYSMFSANKEMVKEDDKTSLVTSL